MNRRAFLKGLMGTAGALVLARTFTEAEAREVGELPRRRLFASAWSAPTDDDRLAALVRAGRPIVGGQYMLTRPLILDRHSTVVGNTFHIAPTFEGESAVFIDAHDEYVSFNQNVIYMDYSRTDYGVYGLSGSRGEVMNNIIADRQRLASGIIIRAPNLVLTAGTD